MVITRFAPSPTGRIHIGTARTALFAFVFARKNSGKFILRIDDTDKERSKKEFEEEIKSSLRWLGITWDEEIRQSEREEIYRSVAYELLERGLAYRCYCDPEELEKMRQEAIRRKKNPMYPGKCRDLKVKYDKPYAIRFKVPIGEVVEFEDIVMGKIRVETVDVEDFVLLRSDGAPTYNLSSVVDDVFLNITHIIRGADHISNTPKQILLMRALGKRDMNFAHLPLILDEKGKISKREGSVDLNFISELQKIGFLKEAVVNHLIRLGWSYQNKEIFSIEEIIQLFSLSDVNSSPAKNNFQKLLWLNSEWMRILPKEDVLSRSIPFIEEVIGRKIVDEDLERIRKIFDDVIVRTKTLRELAEMIKPILSNAEYEGKELEIVKKGKSILEYFLKSIPNTHEDFEKFLKNYEDRRFAAQVVRIAIYGKPVSPPLFSIISALGKEEVERRIKKALSC